MPNQLHQDIITLTVLLSSITAFLGFLLKAFLDLRKNRREEEEAKMHLNDTLGTISADLVAIKSDVSDTKASNDKMLKGLMHSQRFTLQAELKAALLQGYTTQHEFDEIAKMYASYVELGGNGTIKIMFEKFIKLELRED